MKERVGREGGRRKGRDGREEEESGRRWREDGWEVGREEEEKREMSYCVTYVAVLFCRTISMQKSGACPVIPNMVVLRYFSCPAKSMNVMTLEDARQMYAQSSSPERRGDNKEEILFTHSPCPSDLLTTCPFPSNPSISLPTLEVLPDSISCLCRNSLCRACPLPLSSSP